MEEGQKHAVDMQTRPPPGLVCTVWPADEGVTPTPTPSTHVLSFTGSAGGGSAATEAEAEGEHPGA